ncbi:MAG: hypothetical protein L0H59_10445 [Tomitella sp.]|nr:hypothetical protein [Tomitella sp.]
MPTIRQRAAVAAALCLTLMAVGCGSGGDGGAGSPPAASTRTDSRPAAAQPTRSSEPAPDVTSVNPATIDRQNPEAVAIAAVEAIYTVEPAVDESAADAYERAAPLLTPRMIDAIRAIDSPSGSDPNWGKWKRKNAIVAATATIARQDKPIDTDRAYRYIKLVQKVHTDSGSRSQEPIYLFVGLAHGDTGWKLDSMKLA